MADGGLTGGYPFRGSCVVVVVAGRETDRGSIFARGPVSASEVVEI